MGFNSAFKGLMDEGIKDKGTSFHENDGQKRIAV